MKYIYLLFATIFLSFGCTEQMIIIPEWTPIVTERVVLVEELTGASCPNCPQGTTAIDNMIEKYGEQIVVVAIHGDFLAEPISGKSKYDFRNQEGTDLENFLKPWFGKPAAAVNRTEYDQFGLEFAVSVPGLWDQYVEEELNKEHVMEIEATSLTFDQNSRELNVTIAATALTQLDGDYKMTVLLTESHMVDAQKNSSEIIDEYEFNHALRIVLSETLGTTLTTDFDQNERVEKSFSSVIPTDADHPEIWNTENMELVAFVHRVDVDSDGIEHKEVIQAFQEHLP